MSTTVYLYIIVFEDLEGHRNHIYFCYRILLTMHKMMMPERKTRGKPLVSSTHKRLTPNVWIFVSTLTISLDTSWVFLATNKIHSAVIFLVPGLYASQNFCLSVESQYFAYSH